MRSPYTLLCPAVDNLNTYVRSGLTSDASIPVMIQPSVSSVEFDRVAVGVMGRINLASGNWRYVTFESGNQKLSGWVHKRFLEIWAD